MIVNLSEKNTIANHFIAELRDVNVQRDKMRFRRNLERLGEVFAYEISQTLSYEEKQVETPFGISPVNVPSQRIVLVTILRAGIPFHQGFLNFFDFAENAFISTNRRHHKDGTFEVELEHVSCPPVENSVLVVCDPMLATGASMHVALKELKNYGKPLQLHIVTVIASKQGLSYIRRYYPKATIWLGALDEELTAKSYIVPGLGDAGDLCYGAKMKE